MDNYAEKSHVGMSLCFFCNEPKEIFLDRRLEKSLPREAVYNHEPCDKCKEYMRQGIIVISVRDGENRDNPYRTGGWWVIKEDALTNCIDDKKLQEDILLKRVVFIEDSVCQRIGLQKIKEV